MTIVAGLDTAAARDPADFQAAPEPQDTLLTRTMESQTPGGTECFQAFRQQVIGGYVPSEIGIAQERKSLPVPGRHDGACLYSNPNKVFAS